MDFSLYKVTRAALLGTTALVAAGQTTGVRADVTIAANTTNTVGPLAPGDNVTITNSGSVTGTFVGIAVTGATSSGTLTNNGSINVTNRGIVVTSAGVSGAIRNAGNITAGTTGIRIATSASVSGGITNTGSGVIDAARGIELSSQAFVTGGIENAGTMSVGLTGIRINSSSTLAGGISNSGSIGGGQLGIIVLGSSSVGGGISNTQSITATNFALAVSQSTISGGISNGGTLLGGTGLSIDSAQITGDVLNSNLINAGTGIDLVGSSISGALTNTGTITTTNDAIRTANSTISGAVQNNADIISDGVGYFFTGGDQLNNGFVNSGNITANGAAGVGMLNSMVTGDIVNSGIVVTPSGHGLQLDADINGSIRNEGSITAAGFGLLLTAIGKPVTGDVQNRGMIQGGLDGIASSSPINGDVINTGDLIGQTGFGLTLNNSVDGGIRNDGLISGGGLAALFAVGPIGQDVENTGTITGAAEGATLASTIGGGIFNSGDIIGQTSFGMRVLAPVTAGIKNDGLIHGGSGGAGLFIAASVGDGLENNGTIQGGIDGLFFGGPAPLDGGIVNRGQIIGETRAGINLLSNVNGGILNEGLISGADFGLDVNAILDGGIVNRGTIEGGIGLDVSGGTLFQDEIFNSGTITGTGGTAILLNGQFTTLTLGTGSVLNGVTDGGAGDDTLVLTGEGFEDDSFINFEALNVDDGTWTLTADLTLLDPVESEGGVNINSGALYMNGTLTSPRGVFINGGALGGTGDVVGDIIVNAGGAIAPGNSIGILNVIGDVSLGDGSFFDTEVLGSSADLMLVDGSVTIDPGSTVRVLPLGPITDIVNVPIITATGTVDANFQNIETSGLAASTALVGGNEIQLTIVNPLTTSGISGGGIEDGFTVLNTLTGPLPDAELIGPDRTLWIKGIYDQTDRDSAGGFIGYNQDTYGVAIGTDRQFTPQFAFGGSLGYTESDLEFDGARGDGDVQTIFAGLYGIYEKNQFGFRFAGQYGLQDKDTSRPVNIGGTTGNTTGETDGWIAGLQGRASWTEEVSKTWAGTFNLNASYVHQSQDGFIESSGVGFSDVDSDTYRLGPSVDITGRLTNGSVTWRPQLRVGFYEQWAEGDSTIDVFFANGSSAEALLTDYDGTFATAGVGLTALFDSGVTAYIGYDGEFGSDEESNRLSAGLSLGF